ncbi:nuclear transport factor 2 family protein [Streptomyces sp. NPDC058954]|uniref:nuclear transport factor 2 family protein n=1 Tax=Streptomyces sp. NPDC058954 TaxID=3346677 RepID=UPI0036B331E1
MQDAQEFVREYFAAAVASDRGRYFTLFDDDVVVPDDGRSHQGLAAVRRWRTEVPPVRYDLHDITGTPTACTALAEVSGDFPGSPVTLRFTFERNTQRSISSDRETPTNPIVGEPSSHGSSNSTAADRRPSGRDPRSVAQPDKTARAPSQ